MAVQATELSRFVVTRPVAATSESAPTPGAPFSPVLHIDTTASVFHPAVGGAKAQTGAAVPTPAWDLSETKLQAFANGPAFLSSVPAIKARQPGLDALSPYFAAYRANSSLANAVSAFEKGSKESLADYVRRTRLKETLVVLWDNLIYRAASKRNLDLVPALADAIRLANAVYYASLKPSNLRHVPMAGVAAATVALPAIFLSQLKTDDLCVAPPASPPCDGNVSVPWPKTWGEAQPLGWGDLKMIKTSLLRYAAGEIAHVENILAGETHVREFRDLRRSETKDELETENQSELSSSLESTEKFSFEQEVSRASSQSTDRKAGVSASYEYGTVETTGLAKASGYLDYQGKTTKDESQKTATKYAKDVVASATSKLTQRVRSLRSTVTTTEKENKTTHTIDNQSADHRAGVYRWLDKYYLAHVENYGQRLMYEFAVPEPAAFFRYGKLKRDEADLVKPVAPREFVMHCNDEAGKPITAHSLADMSALTPENYTFWISKYGATSTTPPPDPIHYVSWTKSGGVSFQLTTEADLIEIPEGYVAKDADISGMSWSNNVAFALPWTNAWLGGKYYDDHGGNQSPYDMGNKTGKIPAALMSTAVYVVNVIIRCELSKAGLDVWRMAIFSAIMQAYARQLGEYEDKVQQQTADRTNALFGMNPDINRQTEQFELRKSCLEIITGQRFESIDAMRDTAPPPGHFGYPEFSFSEARNEGSYIQFFEKAFEWVNMTYSFAPYFWGRKDRWLDTLKIADVDPLFENFLRAGSARVVVPVRPGYEKDVLDFFSFGWHGMQHAFITIADPRYVSIVEELKEQAGIFPGKRVEPERWVVKVPTTLVYLENPNTTLPDYTKQLWWKPRLRVIVVDSAAAPVPGAKVTLSWLDASGLEQTDELTSANGTVAGAYDFLVDEGTYKVEAADVVGGLSLPTRGTAVVEMSQNAEVAITLWRLSVAVTSAGASVSNATVTLRCLDSQGLSHQVQLTVGSALGVYEFLVNPGTYTVSAVGSGGTPVTTSLQIFQDTPLPMAI